MPVIRPDAAAQQNTAASVALQAGAVMAVAQPAPQPQPRTRTTAATAEVPVRATDAAHAEKSRLPDADVTTGLMTDSSSLGHAWRETTAAAARSDSHAAATQASSGSLQGSASTVRLAGPQAASVAPAAPAA